MIRKLKRYQSINQFLYKSIFCKNEIYGKNIKPGNIVIYFSATTFNPIFGVVLKLTKQSAYIQYIPIEKYVYGLHPDPKRNLKIASDIKEATRLVRLNNIVKIGETISDAIKLYE